jgi:hypothetical protein
MKLALSLATLAGCSLAHGDYPSPPREPVQGATRITISYQHQSSSASYVIEWNPHVGYVTERRAVDLGAIDALYGALTSLVPTDAAVPACSSHADDASSLSIVVEGAHPLSLSSLSNCPWNTPWQVYVGDRTFAQYDGDVGYAVASLLAEVEPDAWRVPDARPAHERLLLGEYRAGDGEPSAAAACAQSIEASPAVRDAFGGAIKIAALSLVCDRAHDAECLKLEASARFDWDDVDARLSFVCSNGSVELSEESTKLIADLRGFLDSKPARVIVQLSSHPQLLHDEHWRLVPLDAALPDLLYEPGQASIDAVFRATHGDPASPFWTTLEVTPATPAFGVLIDFDGHLIE